MPSAPTPESLSVDGAASGPIRFALQPHTVADAPFPHASFQQCLPDDVGEHILSWFERTAPWNHVATDFYEQHEFSCLDSTESVAKLLSSDELLHALRDDLASLFSCRLRPESTVVAHRLLPGHRIGIHNDHRDRGETHRFVIQLNRGLCDADGGLFMLFNSSDPADIHTILRPTNLSGFAFEISPASYHAISEMHENVRYSIVYSFFAVR